MNNRKIALNLFLTFLAAVLVYSAIFLNPLLIWIAFVPLILLAWYNFFTKSLAFFLLSAFLMAESGCYWVVSFDQKYFYLLTIYVTSFFFLFSFLMGLLFSRVRNYFSFLIPGFSYTLVFWLFSVNGIGEYWFNMAILQPRFSYISQIFGELGLTFIILTYNSLLAFWLIDRKRYSYILIFLILSVSLFSANYYARHKIPEGRRVRVAVVQGNFTEDWSWRMNNAGGQVLDKYSELTSSLIDKKVDLVVWPEYALPVNLEERPEIFAKISALARELNANLIVGSLANDGLPLDNEQAQYYDSAYGFDRQGNSLGRYDSLQPFNFKVKRSVGEGYWIFNTDVGKIGALICYDEVFNHHSSAYDKLGIDFFVAISNNEPIKSFVTKLWLKRFSELRAATYNKYYVRSTNTGHSQVVNPYGVVESSLPENQTGVLVADIYLKK